METLNKESKKQQLYDELELCLINAKNRLCKKIM